ncbi:ATP-binding protein [Sinirhodobacter populi]|uniref:ATP-binding protein n=2 Tax=Paenirhodobacter populi TaxID=2306993 RepID=A0A443K403_9RHOB|nr:ATP-binding protein [Sinirhodobacter populi]
MSIMRWGGCGMWVEQHSSSRSFDDRRPGEGQTGPGGLTPARDSAAQGPPEDVDPPEPARHIHLHSFRANPFAVRDALYAARATTERLLLIDDAWALELVLAEIMNNIVEHGYGDGDEGTIFLTLTLQGNDLVCTVGDFGPELPTACLNGERPPPDPGDLPDGGFGWFLIRDLAQDLHYNREEGRNRLTLRFPLANPA